MKNNEVIIEYNDRLDLRVNGDHKEKFRDFCKKQNITLSDAGREALDIYMDSRTFIAAIIENIQDPPFFKIFKKFYEAIGPDIKNPFNKLLGPEEEKLIKSTPPQLLRNVRVVTPSGKKAIQNL